VAGAERSRQPRAARVHGGDGGGVGMENLDRLLSEVQTVLDAID
jgi:hypothetical protein